MTHAATPALSTHRTRLLADLVMLLSRFHTGRLRGVSASQLARNVGVGERTLRLLISGAREQGVAVVGTPETGYYVAETAAELEECCQFLRARAMHSLHIEAQLRRIPLPDLLGQMRLAT